MVDEPTATVVLDLPLAVFELAVQETGIDPDRRPSELDFEEWSARGVLERIAGTRDLTGYTVAHAAELQRRLLSAAGRADQLPELGVQADEGDSADAAHLVGSECDEMDGCVGRG